MRIVVVVFFVDLVVDVVDVHNAVLMTFVVVVVVVCALLLSCRE